MSRAWRDGPWGGPAPPPSQLRALPTLRAGRPGRATLCGLGAPLRPPLAALGRVFGVFGPGRDSPHGFSPPCGAACAPVENEFRAPRTAAWRVQGLRAWVFGARGRAVRALRSQGLRSVRPRSLPAALGNSRTDSNCRRAVLPLAGLRSKYLGEELTSTSQRNREVGGGGIAVFQMRKLL